MHNNLQVGSGSDYLQGVDDGTLWHAGTRRFDQATRTRLIAFLTAIYALTGSFGLALINITEIRDAVAYPTLLLWICIVGLVIAAASGVLLLAGPRVQERLQPAYIYTTLIFAVGGIDAGFAIAGPDRFGYGTAVLLPLPAIITMYAFKRAIARAVLFFGLAGLVPVIFLQDGWVAPPLLMVFLAGYVTTAASLVGGLVARHDEARAEVVRLNAELEQRVEAQVDEIGRLNQLRRFLSPQVADALSSADSGAILAPHRGEIAVFFSDLRSFTRFTVGEAPEDVLISLDDYYSVVCSILQRHGATIGNFGGDGLMAFLGDPLPHDDPAGGAVRIALELQDEMKPLVERWEARGFTLGHGVGIAMGYATLGLLGNEERSDYTAVGPVVNLASRLCSQAANGQILVDHRTCNAIKAWTATDELEPITLKGFPEPVRAFAVLGSSPSA